MDLTSIMNIQIAGVTIAPFLIFLARIGDVSVGTMRIIVLSRGKGWMAPVLGFFEVTIWLLAVSQVINNLDNPVNVLAYAAGYACGNYVGLFIEDRMAMGSVLLRLVTRKDSTALIDYLNEKNIGFTYVDAHGKNGQVQIIYIVLKRKKLEEVIEIVNRYNPNAFFSVEDVRKVYDGELPTVTSVSVPAPAIPALRR
ncbi:MAG: DUF2179 domain-containing protein [bacterium]|nr:DUF2179 domain-containing protein [bacterium]